MDSSWLEDAEQVQQSLFEAGLRLSDKWICSSTMRRGEDASKQAVPEKQHIWKCRIVQSLNARNVKQYNSISK